ncbi:MAG TPA: DUF4279 domain-containing protein [Terracidiphilus sp.]|nr:DUF4279 domain-containing protein [Terracidiphilus sp.]
MGEIGRTKVSLRLFSDDLDPEAVTSLLGRQPTRSWRAGEMKFSRPATFGSWHLQSDLSGDLDAQIRGLLASLSPDIAVWNDLTKQHHADLFCGLFLTEGNQGLVLAPDTMDAIARRGLKLSLDIYGAPDTDEPVGE